MSDATQPTAPLHPQDPLVLWTDDSKQRGFACTPTFCSAPACTCRVVMLIAIAEQRKEVQALLPRVSTCLRRC